MLLKNPENLCDNRNERVRLEEALSINKPLATAYYMKEDLRLLWSQPNKALAEDHLHDWIVRAKASGIRILKDFANTLEAHRRGIVAYYDHPYQPANSKGQTTRSRPFNDRHTASEIEFFSYFESMLFTLQDMN